MVKRLTSYWAKKIGTNIWGEPLGIKEAQKRVDKLYKMQFEKRQTKRSRPKPISKLRPVRKQRPAKKVQVRLKPKPTPIIKIKPVVKRQRPVVKIRAQSKPITFTTSTGSKVTILDDERLKISGGIVRVDKRGMFHSVKSTPKPVTQVKTTQKFLYGTPQKGYTLYKKKGGWATDVWYGGKSVRTEETPTKYESIHYARDRKKSHYGDDPSVGITPYGQKSLLEADKLKQVAEERRQKKIDEYSKKYSPMTGSTILHLHEHYGIKKKKGIIFTAKDLKQGKVRIEGHIVREEWLQALDADMIGEEMSNVGINCAVYPTYSVGSIWGVADVRYTTAEEKEWLEKKKKYMKGRKKDEKKK